MVKRMKESIENRLDADLRAVLWQLKNIKSKFKVIVYMGDMFMNTDLIDLELSHRSYNCLKRVGYSTVGDVVRSISGREDLLKIRNLGINSADEIMVGLVAYQYQILSPEKKSAYLQRLIEINRGNDLP